VYFRKRINSKTGYYRVNLSSEKCTTSKKNIQTNAVKKYNDQRKTIGDILTNIKIKE
jgi:hypothetical protein